MLPYGRNQHHIVKQLSSNYKQIKQASMYTTSQHGLGTWKRDLTMEGGPALASQIGGHLIFIFNIDILYSLPTFSLTLKQMYNVCLIATNRLFRVA